MLAAAGAGWCALWLVGDALGPRVTDPAWRSALVSGAALLGALLALVGVVLHQLKPAWLPGFVVAGTSAVLAGLATIGLHGTRWSFSALYSDGGFRTQAITRYASTPAITDYGYRGLPAYYPPAWPWLQGRLADLLGIQPWAVLKPATLLATALVPLLAYLLWRRVVPPLEAALIVMGTTLVSPDLLKPDEWLVLACVLPWWLDALRGIRAEGRRPLPPWAHGLILGGFLLTYTYYFLPLALATAVGWVADRVRHKPARLGLKNGAVIGVLGLAVSAPYWFGMVALRLSGRPLDNLQMRWDHRGFQMPPLPLPTTWEGLVATLALGWLLLRFGRHRLAQGLALALAAAYVVDVGGQWVQQFGVAVLPSKAQAMVLTVLTAAAVAGVVDLARVVVRRRRLGDRLLPSALVAAVGVALVATAVGTYTAQWTLGRWELVAQQMRYPSGGYPAGRPAVARSAERAWGTVPGDPSADAVARAWRKVSGLGRDSGAVVVSSRTDLLATTPLHSFTAWKSIYSNPAGQYVQRLALLRRVARCPSSGCAARLLRHNRFDHVDGIIAARRAGHLELPLAVDNFPNGWTKIHLRLPLRLFRGPAFRRLDVGRFTVVALPR